MGKIDRLWLWLMVALGLRLLGMSFPNAFAIDMDSFKGWSMILLQQGLGNFYSATWCDYPPSYMYVLWLTGWLYKLFDPYLQFTNGNLLTALIKLTPAIADILACYLIYLILNPLTPPETARRGAISYALNPVIIFLSAVWGQVDGVAVCLMLVTIWLLQQDHFILSAIIGSLTVIIKPQGLFLAPTFLFSQWTKRQWWQWLVAVLLSAGSVWLAILPFYITKISDRHSLVSWLVDPWRALYQQFLSGGNNYPYASVNAFNLWISWNWRSDSLWKFVGLGMLIVLLLWVAIWLYRNPQGMFLATAIVLLGIFVLGTRMHERYIVYALPFLIISSCIQPQLRAIYQGISLTAGVNILYAYVQYNAEPVWNSLPHSLWQTVAIFTAITNLGLLLALISATADFPNSSENCITALQPQTIS